MTNVIRQLLSQTKGRKTYAVVVLGLIYLVGVWFHWWEYESELMNAIVLAAVAALRAGVQGT